jgi:hypothetical protein
MCRARLQYHPGWRLAMQTRHCSWRFSAAQ